MTMPKGFATGEEYNYCTKCPHIEQDHKRVMRIGKATMPKGMELPPSMVSTRYTACRLCDCDELIDKNMAREIQQRAQQEQIRRSQEWRKFSRPQGETAATVGIGLLLASIVVGFITTIVAIIVLNIGAMIIGMLLFLVPILIAQATRGSAGSHNNGYDGFFMSRWGSHQAKKNIRRGYRSSKK